MKASRTAWLALALLVNTAPKTGSYWLALRFGVLFCVAILCYGLVYCAALCYRVALDCVVLWCGVSCVRRGVACCVGVWCVAVGCSVILCDTKQCDVLCNIIIITICDCLVVVAFARCGQGRLHPCSLSHRGPG